jgi:hypothetical protein
LLLAIYCRLGGGLRVRVACAALLLLLLHF